VLYMFLFITLSKTVHITLSKTVHITLSKTAHITLSKTVHITFYIFDFFSFQQTSLSNVFCSRFG